MSKAPRLLATVADLRAALAELDPTYSVQGQLAPFNGVVLEINGRTVTVRAPRNGEARSQ